MIERAGIEVFQLRGEHRTEFEVFQPRGKRRTKFEVFQLRGKRRKVLSWESTGSALSLQGEQVCVQLIF